MRTVGVAVLVVGVLLGSCSEPRADEPPRVEGPVAFRVLSEEQNPTFCVEGPEFAVATTEDDWIDVFDAQTSCLDDPDVTLPDVRFDEEIGIAAWWRVESCLGFDVMTRTVRRVGDELVVTAASSRPGEACAEATGGLESFLALERGPTVQGARAVRFVLDGATAGSAPIGD